MTDKKPCAAGDADVLRPGPELNDGKGSRLFVRHTADHETVTGVMRPAREGENMAEGGFFSLEPNGDRGDFKVTPICTQAAKGPAKVSTPAYRDGWDSIFGKRPVGEA